MKNRMANTTMRLTPSVLLQESLGNKDVKPLKLLRTWERPQPAFLYGIVWVTSDEFGIEIDVTPTSESCAYPWERKLQFIFEGVANLQSLRRRWGYCNFEKQSRRPKGSRVQQETNMLNYMIQYYEEPPRMIISLG
jgi:hypothetical protein